MKKMIALLALAGAAGTTLASVVVPGTLVASASFTNKNSIDAQGDPDNNTGSAVLASGGTIASVRAFGTVNEVFEGTFASEARVRFSAGAGNAFTAFNFQATTVGAYPGTGLGTVAVDRTLNVTPFTLAAGGTMNFEWFESFQDNANLPESNWADVTYEFRTASSIANGSHNFGTLNGNGVTLSYDGSHVSGGLDFITFTIDQPVANLGDYLNIQMLFGATGGMTDTEMALFGPDGSLIASDDDGNVGFSSQLSYGAADPFASGGTDEIAAGFNGLSLAAGTYTIGTGGFNTTWASTLGGAHLPGTNAGTYRLDITFVPTPGAAALLGLGGLMAARRRRA
jgi:hypothetical protein